jgi:hypothetical protein
LMRIPSQCILQYKGSSSSGSRHNNSHLMVERAAKSIAPSIPAMGTQHACLHLILLLLRIRLLPAQAAPAQAVPAPAPAQPMQMPVPPLLSPFSFWQPLLRTLNSGIFSDLNRTRYSALERLGDPSGGSFAPR